MCTSRMQFFVILIPASTVPAGDASRSVRAPGLLTSCPLVSDMRCGDEELSNEESVASPRDRDEFVPAYQRFPDGHSDNLVGAFTHFVELFLQRRGFCGGE